SIGYEAATASRFLSLLLFASLGGRVIVGYIADRFRKKNIMTVSYFLLGAAIPLLFLAKQPTLAAVFAIIFGFAMGADYMLIPLVTAECFGLSSLGKLLALIIVAYSIGQWAGPYIAGRIFDAHHSYDLAWELMATAGVVGSLAIFAIVKRPDHAHA
ncbi:MAG: MFS transporter, partial [Terriglobus sp.]